MAFIQNSKFREISEAAKNGNEKALMIIQALRKKSSQGDLDALVNDYYAIPTINQEEVENAKMDEFEAPEQEIEEVNQMDISSDVQEVDLTKILDGELDGLIDENEIDDLNFNDYLKNKSRDSLRSRKGADYFKAYDQNGRSSYMADKINGYKSKFDGRLKDIERKYNDMNQSVALYSKNVGNMIDDNIELDLNVASKAYDELTNDEVAMGSIGRHWDESDNNIMMEKLKGLIANYGKQNVMAALNTLNSDNNNYRDFLNNQIDTEISRYSKSLEGLLK
jgi:hypothetical protein